MSTVVNQLEVEFKVMTPEVSRAAELRVEVTLTNRSRETMRLNTLLLPIAVVNLQVRTADGSPVPKGPPPVPPVDDGEQGRILLEPSQNVAYTYRGSSLFGEPLDAGSYEVRFRHRNTRHEGREWTGTIETDWLPFQVTGKPE
jgi:hypothetical protein